MLLQPFASHIPFRIYTTKAHRVSRCTGHLKTNLEEVSRWGLNGANSVSRYARGVVSESTARLIGSPTAHF